MVPLVVPVVNVGLLGLRDRVIQLGAINGTTIRGQLTAEVWVIVRACLVKGSNIAVAATPLAVSLGVVCIEVIASGETPVASWHPAYMRLLLGVALHVPLEMLLPLESTFTTWLLASELDLLDDGGQVLKLEALLGDRLLNGLLGRAPLELSLSETFTHTRRQVEVIFHVLITTARYTSHWRP